MQPHRTCFKVLMLACSTSLWWAATAEGAFKDLYWTDEDPVVLSDPEEKDLNDPSAGWTWPGATWTHGPNEPMPVNGLIIRPGRNRLFGLENEFIPYETKTFWISFA